MFNKPVDTTTIRHLANMLGSANIPYEIESAWGGLHIGYPCLGGNFVCSVIQHSFSHGGENGLLEIMGLLTDEEEEYDSVKGWLTAEDVFNRISMHYHATMAKAYADATIIGAGGEVWNGSAPNWD